MKKLLLFVFIAVALFSACKEKQDPACPTVDAELVPSIIKDSLVARYPGVTIETWYKLDTLGFCAKFPQPPNTVFAHFGTDGSFLEAEIKDSNGKEVDGGDEADHENHHDDGEDTCECR